MFELTTYHPISNDALQVFPLVWVWCQIHLANGESHLTNCVMLGKTVEVIHRKNQSLTHYLTIRNLYQTINLISRHWLLPCIKFAWDLVIYAAKVCTPHSNFQTLLWTFRKWKFHLASHLIFKCFVENWVEGFPVNFGLLFSFLV